jgi:hypothetical protein
MLFREEVLEMANDWYCARCRQLIKQDQPWHWKPDVDGHPGSPRAKAKILVQRVHSLPTDCEKAKASRLKRESPVCSNCGQSIRRGEGRPLEELTQGPRIALAFVHTHQDYCRMASLRRQEASQSA